MHSFRRPSSRLNFSPRAAVAAGAAVRVAGLARRARQRAAHLEPLLHLPRRVPELEVALERRLAVVLELVAVFALDGQAEAAVTRRLRRARSVLAKPLLRAPCPAAVAAAGRDSAAG